MKYNLTAAVIGSGYMGKQHIEILNTLVDRVILCSNDQAGGRELAQKYGCDFYSSYEEMYKQEDLDFVSVCLPTHLHHHATMKALQAGINVLCEKPFAGNFEEAEEMHKAAVSNNLLLMVGHPVRFSKSYEYLKRCIADNRFGRLLYLDLYRHVDMPTWSVDNWLQDVARSGGVVRDMHIHDTDIIVGMLGQPQDVLTQGGATACRTVYNYGNGVAVSASSSWRNAKGFPFYTGFDAVFENASIQKQGTDVMLYQNGSAINPLEQETFSEFFQDSGVSNEIHYFCHCIENNLRPEICPPEDTLRTMAVNDAEIESLNEAFTPNKQKGVKIC